MGDGKLSTPELGDGKLSTPELGDGKLNTGELIWSEDPPFPENAKRAVNNSQLRRNVRNATATIRQRRAGLVAETPDWQELR
ncbi:MAG: hypothetical protein JO243_19195, partial [Solirubrobacterales bacterium]|nr:hypothetical protein [Solirubrobacterales bacterium]